MRGNIDEKLSYCNSVLCDNYNNSLCILVPIFFEIGNAFGEREYIVDEDANNKVMYSQQVIDTKCKSPCPSSAEMCIAMCA